LNQKNKN